MANITELALARKAKGALEKIGAKRREKIVEILRNANTAAQRAMFTFSSERTLNDARSKARIALTILIPALEAHLETRGQKDKAKIAIDDWIKELQARGR